MAAADMLEEVLAPVRESAIAALLVPVLAAEFDHASPPLAGWLVAIASAAAVLAVDALGKRRRGPRSLDERPSHPVRV